MHLLYLDESGHPTDKATQFFVLAGFSIFETQPHWLDSSITPIAERFNPTDPGSIEFHGACMRSGSEGWKQFPPAMRVQALVDILSLLGNTQLKLRVFASVIQKSTMSPAEVLPKAFEHVSSQFDNYLATIWTRHRDAQRGLVIFDKTDYEQKLQAMSYLFKHKGHTNGRLRNFAEVPLFLDSKASRLIQMADLIAYWIYRFYEATDDRGYKLIEPYFYKVNGCNAGLMTSIAAQTAGRLANVTPHLYPFPTPSI